jgi:hypothetical protein
MTRPPRKNILDFDQARREVEHVGERPSVKTPSDDEVRRDVERSMGKMLVEAMDALRIRDNRNYESSLGPTQWYLIDESKSDIGINYPGQLISKHDRLREAEIARGRAILIRIGVLR